MALKVLEKETFYCELGQYVVYKAFRKMIPQERAKVFELLKENICDLVVTKVGTLLVLDLIAYGGAKDRKAICRQLKTIMPFILAAQHKKAINVLNKLILEIDDVVVLNRLLLNTIKQNIALLFDREKNGPIIQILLTIFTGESKALQKFDSKPATVTTSKKDKKLRRQQISSFMLGTMI